MTKSRKLTEQSVPQLEDHIRKAAQNSIQIEFSHHARQQMRKRKITLPCALEALRRGRIRRTPEPNNTYGTLECRMEYYSAGFDIGVVVALSDDDPAVIVVTAMHI